LLRGFYAKIFSSIKKRGNEVIFYSAPEKLMLVDIDKTTGMETASYALKLKLFDKPPG
jgi:hypothetical protein